MIQFEIELAEKVKSFTVLNRAWMVERALMEWNYYVASLSWNYRYIVDSPRVTWIGAKFEKNNKN